MFATLSNQGHHICNAVYIWCSWRQVLARYVQSPMANAYTMSGMSIYSRLVTGCGVTNLV